VADRGRGKAQALRRATDVQLLHNGLKKHKQIEIRPREVSFIQHIPEIIPLDSSRRKEETERRQSGLTQKLQDFPCVQISEIPYRRTLTNPSPEQ
jgi:hypothetical protein